MREEPITKEITVDLMPFNRKHWAQNLADTLILLESEGWLTQEIFANSSINPCKAFVKLKLARPTKTPPQCTHGKRK